MAVISKLKLDHPSLGTSGGATLHAAVEALYKKIGDNMADRLFFIKDLNASASADCDHNFQVPISNLRLDLYLWDEATGELTRITTSTTPSISQFTIAAKSGSETKVVTVTNNSGAQRDLVLITLNDPINLGELVDVDLITAAPTDAQTLIYDVASKTWKPASLSSISGTLSIAKGGTGQTTANLSLNALLPSQTSHVNKYLKTDGTNVSWQSTSSSGLSGELTYITNASGELGTSGWGGGLDPNQPVRDSSAASMFLPLSPIISTSLQISHTATAETSTSGAYTVWTVPGPTRMKKTKVEFYYFHAGSDTWAVSVYGLTRVPLSTDVGGVSTLSVGTNRFIAYFDGDGAYNYSLNITRTSGSYSALNVAGVLVGPGTETYSSYAGFIPIGGIVPVFKHLTGSYSLPATGVVSADGWMLCDGSAIPSGKKLSGTVPNLTGSVFVMGTTGSGTGTLPNDNPASGGTGGGNSKTTSGGSATFDKTELNTNQVAHSHSIPAHYHGVGTLSIGSGGSHNHSFSNSLSQIMGLQNNGALSGGIFAGGGGQFRYGDIQGVGDHSHGITGYVGPWPAASNGDAAFNSSTASVSWSSATVSTTFTQPSISDSRPKYVGAVYLIRVS